MVLRISLLSIPGPNQPRGPPTCSKLVTLWSNPAWSLVSNQLSELGCYFTSLTLILYNQIMARWLWTLICNILITIIPILGLWGLNEMIPIEGLGLVCLSLTTTIFFPILLYAYILDFLPELTLFLNFRACCSRFTERRGEDGTMMKINLNFSCAKSPRLTRPWVTYSQPNSGKQIPLSNLFYA